jgi:hypothetical protein
MKKLLTIILVGMILSLTSISFAGEYNSNVGIESMQDRTFQLNQQYEICKSNYTNAKEIKECYMDCKKSYDLFIKYMNTEDMQNPVFSACLEEALKKYWLPQKNTTDWFLVIGITLLCCEEIMR